MIRVRVIGKDAEGRAFAAGLFVHNDRCSAASDRLAWCLGHDTRYLRREFLRRGYKATIVENFQRGEELPRPAPMKPDGTK